MSIHDTASLLLGTSIREGISKGLYVVSIPMEECSRVTYTLILDDNILFTNVIIQLTSYSELSIIFLMVF